MERLCWAIRWVFLRAVAAKVLLLHMSVHVALINKGDFILATIFAFHNWFLLFSNDCVVRLLKVPCRCRAGRLLHLQDQHLFENRSPDTVPFIPGHGGQGFVAHGGQQRPAHVLLQGTRLYQIRENGPR